MGKNPDYYSQIRACGVCSLCRQPMPDDDPRLAHRECRRLIASGLRESEIRALAASRKAEK